MTLLSAFVRGLTWPIIRLLFHVRESRQQSRPTIYSDGHENNLAAFKRLREGK